MMVADVQIIGGKRCGFTARMNDAAVEHVSLVNGLYMKLKVSTYIKSLKY